jgi:hypothetical protein
MEHIKKFNENFSKSNGDIKIGDRVMISSFEGDPTGVVYDIITLNTKLLDDPTSYWVDLGKFGKMEFSREELVKVV